MLIQAEPQQWVNTANLTLLVPILVAFEAARNGSSSHQH
jgi:hypothetical protein